MTGRILIVEDEPDLLDTVRFGLEREGWDTIAATNGRLALEAAWSEPKPDLILLDVMLPDIPGTDVCRQLRADPRTNDVPIVMVTARDEEIDRVVGFEVGADDYVAKPFSLRELLLRVKAILRRTEKAEASPPGAVFGRLLLDREAHSVQVDSTDVTLTALEFRLLSTLLNRRGRVQTRDALLQDVWGQAAGVPTRTVDTHVQRLRKKLGAAAVYIETLRGVGYRFRAAPDETPHAD